MSYDEFKYVVKKAKVFDKFLYGFSAICLIIFMVYLLCSRTQNNLAITFEILMIMLGTYVLYAVYKLDKFLMIKNKLSLEENSKMLKQFIKEISSQNINENYTKFTYFKNNIWRTPYQVFVYAGNNFVAINARVDYPGIVDLGASARMEKRLIRLFSEANHN